MPTTNSIKTLTLNVATGTDSKNQIDLVLGYYSTHGNVPLFKTLPLHARGTFIGSSLDLILEADKDQIPDDIATIFSLELKPVHYYSPNWVPEKVLSVRTEDAGGTKAELVKDLDLDGTSNPQKFYEKDPPRPGVQGVIYDVTSNNSEASPDISLKAGQMLTIRIDPGQTWKMGGVECNANGPLHPFDEPYFTGTAGVNYTAQNYTFTRGAFVANISHRYPYHYSKWYRQYFPVGSYIRVPVLQDGYLRFSVWDNTFTDNEGKLGVEIEVTEFDPDEYAANPPPASAKSIKLQPQNMCYKSSNPPLVDTGVDLKAGDVLHLRCDPYDTWNLDKGAGLATNANGYFSPISGQNNPRAVHLGQWFFFSRGCLLGTLDDGKTYFGIGTWLDMTVQQKGRLKLICWDDSAGDDTGDIEAKIWTSAAPYLPAGTGAGPHPPATGDIAITINSAGSTGTENIVLTNNKSDELELGGLTLQIPTGSSKGVKEFTFPAGTKLAAGDNLTVYIGDKPGKPYCFKSPVPMLWGGGKDRVLLVSIIEEQTN